MTNPLESGFRAGPQSPFQAAPANQAPLFVRDRYGSADSTNTAEGETEPKPMPRPSNEDDAENPWVGQSGRSPEREKSRDKPELPPVDTGVKAWSILGGAFIFEALIWGRLYALRAKALY